MLGPLEAFAARLKERLEIERRLVRQQKAVGDAEGEIAAFDTFAMEVELALRPPVTAESLERAQQWLGFAEAVRSNLQMGNTDFA